MFTIADKLGIGIDSPAEAALHARASRQLMTCWSRNDPSRLPQIRTDPTVKPDDLRVAIQREPFLAFDVHTKAGRTYPVVHPENIAFSPRVEVVLIKHDESQTAMIDLQAITEVTFPASKPKKGRA